MSKEIQRTPTVEYTVDSDGITHGVIDNTDVFLVVPARSSDSEDSNNNSTAHDSNNSSDNETTVAEGEQFYCYICGKSFFSYTTRALHELSHHTNNLQDDMGTLKDRPLAAVADIDTDATESANEVYYVLQKDQKTSKDGPLVDVAAMNITGLEKDQPSKDSPPVDVAATNSMTYCGLEKDQTSNDGPLVDVAATNITYCGLEKDQTSKDSALADVDSTNSADGLYCRACNSQFTSTFMYTLHMNHHEFQDGIQVSSGSDVERTMSIKEDPGMTGCEVADMTVNSNSRTDNPCDKTYVKSEKSTNLTTPCCHVNIVEELKSPNSSNSEIGSNLPSLFKCKCCGKYFKSVDTFVKSHKKCNVVEGESTAGIFKCTQCNSYFKNHGQLKRHRYRHVFPNRGNLAPVDTDENSRSFIQFECYVCGNTFHSHKDLNVHKKRHFQEDSAVTSIEACDDIQTRSQAGGRAAFEVVKLGTPLLLQHAARTNMADIDTKLLQDKVAQMADKDAEFSQHAARTKMADIDTKLLQDKITQMADKDAEFSQHAGRTKMADIDTKLLQDKRTQMADKDAEFSQQAKTTKMADIDAKLLHDKRTQMADKDAEFSQHAGRTKMADKDAEFSQYAGRTKMADIDTKLLQVKKSKTAGTDEKLQQEKRTKMATKDTVLLQDDTITKTAKKNALLLQVKLTKLSDKDVKLIQNRSAKMADKDAAKHPDNKDSNAGSSVAGFDPRGYCLINESQFLVGMDQKDDKEQHRCRLCQRVFTTCVGLNVHVLSHRHSDEKPFVCSICGERFVLGIHLYVHKRKHKNFKTNWDNKPDIKGKIGTKKCFNSSVNNILRCECGRSFANRSNLYRHRELHNTPGSRLFNSENNSVGDRVRNFICQLCKRTFISRSSLQTHKMSHRYGRKRRNTDQLKNRKISKCSKNTVRLTSKFECLCGKRFRDSWVMSRHTSRCKYLSSRGIKRYVTTQTSLSKTTTTTTTTEEVSIAGVLETRTLRRCGLCEKVVATNQLYKVHVARHWNPKSKLFISTVDPLLLKEQISVLDSGDTRCLFCGKRSLNTKFAVNHLKVHIGIKPFACRECGCRYTLKENLRRHVRNKHEQKCSLDTYRKHVGKGMDSYRKISPNQRCKTGIEHAKINHRKDSGGKNVNVKKHVCKVCKKTFLDSNSLKEHSNKHTSLKPFTCLECGKMFKSREGKKGHMLNFHGSLSSDCNEVQPNNTKNVGNPDDDAVEKPDESKRLLCVVCDKVFRFERQLDTHMFSHTGELPWPCRLCDKRYTTFNHLARHMISIHSDTYHRYTRDQHSHLVKFIEDQSH